VGDHKQALTLQEKMQK
jgi:chromosome segregation ATPase